MQLRDPDGKLYNAEDLETMHPEERERLYAEQNKARIYEKMNERREIKARRKTPRKRRQQGQQEFRVLMLSEEGDRLYKLNYTRSEPATYRKRLQAGNVRDLTVEGVSDGMSYTQARKCIQDVGERDQVRHVQNGWYRLTDVDVESIRAQLGLKDEKDQPD